MNNSLALSIIHKFNLTKPTFFRISSVTAINKLHNRSKTSSSTESTEESIYDEYEPEIIDTMRNKSRLERADYRKLHNLVPELTEDEKNVMDLQSYRKLYGMHGSAAGIDVGKLWPSKRETALLKEYEEVAFPHSVKEMIEIENRRKIEEEREIQAKQEKIRKNLEKLDGWMSSIKEKMAKQEQARLEHITFKQKQLEDVRRVLGYHILPSDPKFAETVEEMEAEDKKRAKKQKKLQRQQQMMDELKAFAAQSENQVKQGGAITEGVTPPPLGADPTKDR